MLLPAADVAAAADVSKTGYKCKIEQKKFLIFVLRLTVHFPSLVVDTLVQKRRGMVQFARKCDVMTMINTLYSVFIFNVISCA